MTVVKSKNKYQTVIGLEIHVQLATKSKIFCACSTRFGDTPNQNTCPVCLGLPGALPVLNKKVVELSMMLGLALNCKVQKESIWDRKNYYYQDLPKGYQITQYQKPICLAGFLNVGVGDNIKKIKINRIHMEEDAGKSIHSADGNTQVDLNRTGVPLCEVVTEPDISSPKEAAAFLSKMRALVRYAGVSDGNMEQGSLRCDANISLKSWDCEDLGTKVELKNLNSIKFVEKALRFEEQRQAALLEAGKEIVQETRLFDSDKGITESMRTKEEAHDYRYFPDPDLVPLIIDDNWINACEKSLPEMPEVRQKRFMIEYGLSEYDSLQMTAEKEMADYFESVLSSYNEPKKVANWMMTELMRILNELNISVVTSPVTPQMLAELLILIDDNVINVNVAKKIFATMFTTGGSAKSIVKKLGLEQVDDKELIQKVVDEIIANNPSQVAEYKQGKEKLFGFFVGQVMRALKGKANPKTINDILKKALSLEP